MKLNRAEVLALAATLLLTVLTAGHHLALRRVPPAFSVHTAAEEACLPAPAAATEDGKIDINRAGKDELCGLSGIGETLAERIIAYREANGGFARIEDITRVSGIGSVTYEKIRSRITVG